MSQCIKTLEDKESTLWKESQQKQINFQDNIESLKTSFKENNDEVNQNMITVQRRLDESEFKIAALIKTLEGFNVNFQSFFPIIIVRKIEIMTVCWQ